MAFNDSQGEKLSSAIIFFIIKAGKVSLQNRYIDSDVFKEY